jgi:hypothetical protein
MLQNKADHEARHVLLRHGSSFANLVCRVDCALNATGVFNPHGIPPQTLRSYESPAEARAAFAGIVQAFQDHGWQTLHDGRPNFG